MEVVPLSALPQAALMRVICSWKVTLSDGGRASQCAVPGCSDEGHLFLEGDTVVLLSSFGSKFGELVRFLTF